MEYKELAETVYKIFKSDSQWNNKDYQRLIKVEQILQEEIEKELAKAGLIESNHQFNDVKPMNIVDVKESIKNTFDFVYKDENEENLDLSENIKTLADEVITNIKPQSFLERVIIDADAAFDKEIITQKEVNKPKVEEIELSYMPLKRYMITIICTGIQSKPKFQIFKGDDIIDKDFKTDTVISHQQVYFAVIDTVDKKNVFDEIKKHFSNAYISDYNEQKIDWIPSHYQTIWQNRTKLN